MQDYINDTNHVFKKEWITDGPNPEMIGFAKDAGEFLAGNPQKPNDGLSTSSIRNIYSEIKRIQNNYEQNKASFYLLLPKVSYAYGRTTKRRDNNIVGDRYLWAFRNIFEVAQKYVTDDVKTYNNFCSFMEAILAYHKFYGGNK
ncbi:MAG: type III-A CRISPR-associated protein Csm2 [Muribaculaceae bacterium]|nr:type III-A CRISPR-associated protein Csm2 [Muribaculaceae bacterium]